MEEHKEKATFMNKMVGKEGQAKIKRISRLLGNTKLINNYRQLLFRYSNILAHQKNITNKEV